MRPALRTHAPCRLHSKEVLANSIYSREWGESLREFRSIWGDCSCEKSLSSAVSSRWKFWMLKTIVSMLVLIWLIPLIVELSDWLMSFS